MKLHSKIIILALLASTSVFGQTTLYFKDGENIYIGRIDYKTSDRIYFKRMDTLFWTGKEEISFMVKFKSWNTLPSGESKPTWDTLTFDKIPAIKTINGFTKQNLIHKYANRSSAGIVMTLVVPSVTSVLALQQGVVEIAYVGLASSVIGIGLWLSGINQLRTALELGEAIHYTP